MGNNHKIQTYGLTSLFLHETFGVLCEDRRAICVDLNHNVFLMINLNEANAQNYIQIKQPNRNKKWVRFIKCKLTAMMICEDHALKRFDVTNVCVMCV